MVVLRGVTMVSCFNSLSFRQDAMLTDICDRGVIDLSTPESSGFS